ncbi:hypothetical protein Sste5346_007288 [Sporothrix stenoceras]|uniref:Zn(2)-C6 fungal-type domain-containing protein n=1 Tax=Sporothrix stenoceras TaxID=5173 RepID=A0ABR3YVD2_9PEZI
MGRAPTSGNCHTCRQRRVKCDQARPECARCVRGGFTCQGYETVLRMQNHAVVAGAAPGSVRLAKVQEVSSYPKAKPTAAASAAASASARVAASTPKPTPRTAPRRMAAATTQPTIIVSRASSSPSTTSSSTLTPPCIRALATFMPSELSLVGFVDDMAFSYFFQAYGWINMHSILLQDSAMRRHLLASDSAASSPSSATSSHSQSAPSLPGDSMAQDSLRALCYGLLGRDKHVPALQDAGRRVYGKAISDLRAVITTPTAQTADLAFLVKPISLLGAYSVAIERDRRFTHHAGLARILEICGPEAFQSPTLLPIFESARMTLVADSIVRRHETTFLDKPEWKTVPWALDPSAKSFTNRLLDVLSGVPSIIQGTWEVFNDRVAWLAAGGPNEVPRIEHPETVPALQARVKRLREAAAAWHHSWITEDTSTTAEESLARKRVLAWAYAQVGDDTYRPGIFGVQGPDLFRTSLHNVLASWQRDGSPLRGLPSSDPSLLATHMQDAALYTTVLVWCDRLDRYLGHAARSPTCTDFFSRPFRSPCPCRDTVPPSMCQTVPPILSTNHDSQTIAWNASTCTMAGGPVRCVNAVRVDMEWPSPAAFSLLSVSASSPSASSAGSAAPAGSPLTPADLADLTEIAPEPVPPFTSEAGTFTGTTDILLPGDIRFVAHMRILSYLCSRLPATRGPVLATLAAVGLAHCAHDVRPAEGHADIAAVAVAKVFDSTGVDGAADILLRRYTPATTTAG